MTQRPREEEESDEEKQKEIDRESHNHSAQLMNVRRRVAAPPQGAALITDRAWLGVVIESNDN